MNEFAGLVDRHYEHLFRFALALTKDRDHAADLVQETFCIWAEKGHQLRDRAKAKTWLFTTLHREFLGQRRRAWRYAEEELDEEKAASLAAPEDEADRRMDAQRALELLGELEELYRSPLTLFYLQQHSYKEIAEILHIPVGTVMSRLARGKEILRRRMTAEPSSVPRNILVIEPERLRRRHG